MMRRNAIFAILALAAAFVCPAEDGNSDEKIKRMIVRSNFYPKFGNRGFRYCRIANEPVAFPVTGFVRSET